MNQELIINCKIFKFEILFYQFVIASFSKEEAIKHANKEFNAGIYLSDSHLSTEIEFSQLTLNTRTVYDRLNMSDGKVDYIIHEYRLNTGVSWFSIPVNIIADDVKKICIEKLDKLRKVKP